MTELETRHISQEMYYRHRDYWLLVEHSLADVVIHPNEAGARIARERYALDRFAAVAIRDEAATPIEVVPTILNSINRSSSQRIIDQLLASA